MPDLSVILALVFFAALAYYFHTQQTPPKEKHLNLDDLTVDLTQRARDGKLDPVVGMDHVVQRLLHVIARKQKNNPLLIGEPGVGKTAAVEGLAHAIATKTAPKQFQNKTILSLNTSVLLADTKYRGELEERLQALLHQLETQSRRMILFVDEIHTLQQAKGSEGSMDIADILKPALSRGDLTVIGATTWQEYERYIKPDGALNRRFQPVLVEEPSRDTAVHILEGVKDTYESFHGVCIPKASVRAAVDASMQFIHDRYLPDKAFDVIDEACAKVSLEHAQPSHGAPLGVLHAASAYAAECGGDSPVVTEEIIHSIASEWNDHREEPKEK